MDIFKVVSTIYPKSIRVLGGTHAYECGVNVPAMIIGILMTSNKPVVAELMKASI